MSYNFNIEMSASIGDTVAMDMVIAAVETQTSKKVLNIQPMYDGTRFNGFQITFDPKFPQKVVQLTSTKEFIVEHFGAKE